MKLQQLILRILGLAVLMGNRALPADSQCPYLPEFKVLQSQLSRMDPADAIGALERYAGTHENPAACEGIELDRLMGEQESKLIYLTAGASHIDAQAVYRCSSVDPQTKYCDGGPTADDTAHPFSAGIRPITDEAINNFSLVCLRKGFRLIGVYQARLGDILDGKAVTALSLRLQKDTVSIPRPERQRALIAVFKTPGPWAYRKVVWYF